MKTTQRIGKYFKTWRLIHGIQSKEVAKTLGINSLTYSRFERGINVGTNIFNKLETVYSIRLEDIVRDLFKYEKV